MCLACMFLLMAADGSSPHVAHHTSRGPTHHIPPRRGT